MNNNITEDYCSFEVSKLLEEKGCKLASNANYWILAKDHSENYKKGLKVDESKVFFAANLEEFNKKVQIDEEREHNVYHVFSVPTHSLAIKWIRENFGIHISIFPSALSNNELGDLKGVTEFYARIDNRWNLAHSNDGKNIPYRDYVAYTKYKSWEEATEAALIYVLKNLI